jgi:adenylate cyclase
MRSQEPLERRLTAIFAADVAGYSRLMSADEVTTMRTLTAHREVMDRLIAQHRGRIANTAGDSVLAEFPSVVDALQCAVQVQEELLEKNEGIPPDRKLVFRIGVHVGDVMVRGGDLLGDGINVAARLQTLAEPGGICVSGEAHHYARKSLPLTFTDLGEQAVKHIAEGVRAYAVQAAGTRTPETPVSPKKSPPLPDKPAIAVLPFTNMSGDPAQAYFSDGITEDVITELSRFRELSVIARHSSFVLREQGVTLRELGQLLRAAYLVEGSVRRAENRVRITAQLVDADSGAHLWAERYDRSIEDVFIIQAEIAQNIVATVAQRVIDDAHWREFDSAERHLDLARAMNPNDHMIQIVWAWVQACVGNPEHALPAVEIAFRLNPRYPSWYNFYLSCILFQLGRFGEVASLLEQRIFDAPARHGREMGWRAAACAYINRADEAQKASELFLRTIGSCWNGDPAAGPSEYVNWLVDSSCLKRHYDMERLREGLRLAGLPA